MTPVEKAEQPAPEGMTIGHVHLRVSDLSRSIQFYRDVIGLNVMQRFGAEAAFLSHDGYHHRLGLNVWSSLGADPSPSGHPGLYHIAFCYPSRRDLATAVLRVLGADVRLTGAADHGVSEAVYLDDPDRNGIELYWDKPRLAWPIDEEGTLAMTNVRLDLDALLSEVS